MCAVAAADTLLEAGVGWLQFRHKAHFSRRTYEQAQRIGGLCEAGKAIFVINDRADVARMVGAGLHVGQQDLQPADAKAVTGAEGFIGYSTHNADQLAAGDQEPVDYLAIGPVFATGSKENPDPVVGVEALAHLRTLTDKPLVAIGGITLENAGDVFAAGMDAVALIGALLPADGSLGELRRRAERWVRATRGWREE